MQSTLVLIGAALLAAPGPELLGREDFRITTDDGIGIAVREVNPLSGCVGRDPLILLHGARAPGIASFDLNVPGGSLAADLVRLTGRCVFIFDARAYGRSDRPPEMQRPASQSEPLSRAFTVIRDVDAVVREAQKRSGSRQVALLGWATGGLWAGLYASPRPERINHLILLNSLYAGSGPHPLLGPGSTTSDPQHPDRLNPSIGGYALADAASLLRPWDRSIPDEDKARWRDPAVASAYVEAAIASDPRSLTTTPPTLRAPSGALEDSFVQASGRRLYDAGSITATVLLIRSGRDFWSRTEDLENFAHDAVHAKRVERLDLPEATHFVHLERSDRGRDLLLAAVRELLNSSS